MWRTTDPPLDAKVVTLNLESRQRRNQESEVNQSHDVGVVPTPIPPLAGLIDGLFESLSILDRVAKSLIAAFCDPTFIWESEKCHFRFSYKSITNIVGH